MSAEAPDWRAAPLAPVAGAIAALRSGFWDEAIDLWRDRLRSPVWGRLAAACAAEAALRSGRYGVADHMLAQFGGVPGHLAALAGEAEEVRARRAPWFGEGARHGGTGAAEQLLALALYRDALAAAAQAPPRSDSAIGIAIRALSGLGRHPRVLALAADADPADERVVQAIAAARTASAERERDPAAHVAAFRDGHPCATELDRALAALAAA